VSFDSPVSRSTEAMVRVTGACAVSAFIARRAASRCLPADIAAASRGAAKSAALASTNSFVIDKSLTFYVSLL